MISLQKIYDNDRTGAALAGWRNWILGDDVRLASTGFGRQTWPPGINEAACIYDHTHDAIAPVKECECGLYARFQLEGYSSDSKISVQRKIVSGLVAAKGNIQIHDEGFRSEEMQILALLDNNLLTQEEMNQISSYYEVSFFDSVYDVLKYFQKNKSLCFLPDSKISDLSTIKPTKTFDHQGYLHSYNDLPAEVTSYGIRRWYEHGKIHRETEPAEIYLNGCLVWRKDGLIHRDDGPAQIYPGGPEIWFQHNKIHRDDGPAVIDRDSQEWYRDGELHRDGDLPAIIYNSGQKEWWQNNLQHRDNGKPAVVYPDGSAAFYEKGHLISKRDIFGVRSK